jgi:hypothetical protein
VYMACKGRREAHIDSSEVTVNSAGVMVKVAAVIVVVAVLHEGLAYISTINCFGKRFTLESHW